jgi:hypothetical protein
MTQQLTPNYGLPYYQPADPADGATQQQALAQKLDTVLSRTIAGTVSFNGTILAGSGFTAARSATGLYAITFPSAFRHVGTTATAYSTGADTRAVVDPISTPNAVTVRTFTALNTLADVGFSFTATGAGA